MIAPRSPVKPTSSRSARRLRWQRVRRGDRATPTRRPLHRASSGPAIGLVEWPARGTAGRSRRSREYEPAPASATRSPPIAAWTAGSLNHGTHGWAWWVSWRLLLRNSSDEEPSRAHDRRPGAAVDVAVLDERAQQRQRAAAPRDAERRRPRAAAHSIARRASTAATPARWPMHATGTDEPTRVRDSPSASDAPRTRPGRWSAARPVSAARVAAARRGGPHRRHVSGRHVEALGIERRVGERRRAVVREVAVAVVGEAHDEAERHDRRARCSTRRHGVGWPWITSCCNELYQPPSTANSDDRDRERQVLVPRRAPPRIRRRWRRRPPPSAIRSGSAPRSHHLYPLSTWTWCCRIHAHSVASTLHMVEIRHVVRRATFADRLAEAVRRFGPEQERVRANGPAVDRTTLVAAACPEATACPASTPSSRSRRPTTSPSTGSSACPTPGRSRPSWWSSTRRSRRPDRRRPTSGCSAGSPRRPTTRSATSPPRCPTS